MFRLKSAPNPLPQHASKELHSWEACCGRGAPSAIIFCGHVSHNGWSQWLRTSTPHNPIVGAGIHLQRTRD